MQPPRPRPLRPSRRFGDKAPQKHRRLGFNLSRALFVLPNLFTLSSIFCAFYAIILSCGGPGSIQLHRATLAIFFSIFFDLADGRVARMTRTQSDFGVQLDSLADAIAFGVAPAVVVWRWALCSLGVGGALLAFVFVACGVMRLARFNVIAARSPKAADSVFIGLPIPVAAGVLTSLVMVQQRLGFVAPLKKTHVAYVLLTLSYLMVSNVRYRTFKQVGVGLKSLLATAIAMASFFTIAIVIEPSVACLAFSTSFVAMGVVEHVMTTIRALVAKSAREQP